MGRNNTTLIKVIRTKILSHLALDENQCRFRQESLMIKKKKKIEFQRVSK